MGLIKNLRAGATPLAARADDAASGLEDAVGAQAVISDPAELALFQGDGGVGNSQAPAAVVLPADERALARAMRFCHENGFDAVIRGGGTSLRGGAVGGGDSVVIVTTRLNRILDVDRRDRRMQAEAGVMLGALDGAARGAGLRFAQAPASPTPATLGGAIAKNISGGGAAPGSMAASVSGLRLVLIDGDIVDLGDGAFDCGGYDFAGLIAGSEGILGAISAATLTLSAAPDYARTVVAHFAPAMGAGAAVRAGVRLVAERVAASALDVGDARLFTGVRSDAIGDLHGFDTSRGGAVLTATLEGSDDEDVQAAAERVAAVAKGEGAGGVVIEDDEAASRGYGQAREMAFARLARDKMTGVSDVVVPVGQLDAALGALERIAEAHDLELAHIVRVSTGTVQSVFLGDASRAEGAGAIDAAIQASVRVASEFSGLSTGELGAGVVKIAEADGGCLSDADLALQQRLKTVFDGNGAVNRGKVLPAAGQWMA